MTCKNCGNNFEGNFCNNCGQSSKVSRIDFKFLVHEIPNSVFQLNRGFFYTIKELCVRPGSGIRDYLAGKRKRFYKPIAYLLITSALYILTAHLMGINTFIADLFAGFMRGLGVQEQSYGVEIINWILKNQTYLTLLFIPLFSLASYIAFKNYKYNYVEHFVLNLYVTGQQMLIYLILSFVITKDNTLIIFPIALSMTYNIWTYIQFFDKKHISKLIRILLTYILYLIEIFLILFVIAGFLEKTK